MCIQAVDGETPGTEGLSRDLPTGNAGHMLGGREGDLTSCSSSDHVGTSPRGQMPTQLRRPQVQGAAQPLVTFGHDQWQW